MPDRADVVVSILRVGALAHRLCQRVGFANVEAVFDRCLYLRSDDDFVCIGGPDLGNGPITLIGNFEVLPAPKSLAGQVALISSERITIGNSVRFTLNHSELWRPTDWPLCPSPERLTDICTALASRVAICAPQEGLARYVVGWSETSGRSLSLTRIASPRITIFERWMSGLLEAKCTPVVTSREAVQGIIGLGPGLTPSGDDFLVGALAALDALGEREAHEAMSCATVDVLPGLTTPLSACFLRGAAARHLDEKLHRVVSSVITGDVDAAIAIAAEIGHTSGWDMIAGILTTLRIAAARRRISSAAHAFTCL